MYKFILQNGRTVGYYIDEIPDDRLAEDYVSVSIPAENTYAAYELHRRGFQFMDRSLPIEISIKDFRLAINMGKKFHTSVTKDWIPQEICSAAEETFDRDSRFVWDLRENNTILKNELLHGFILEQKRQGAMATLLYRDGVMTGFNLWNIDGSTCAGRILLGAVSAPYRNTGAGLLLYSNTVNAMKERGVKVLRDIVPTTNTASLNLHAAVFKGGIFRFGQCRDCYKRGCPTQHGKRQINSG